MRVAWGRWELLHTREMFIVVHLLSFCTVSFYYTFIEDPTGDWADIFILLLLLQL